MTHTTKNTRKSLTATVNETAAKAARAAAQSQVWDFDALNRREDAESQSFRNAEVRAGRAWPFSTNG